jgi:DNA-binding transcriptional LysR family regulator
VQSEKFVAALPARHAVARRPGRVAVRDLAGEPFVMVPREIAPGLYDIVAGLAARAGFSLQVAQEAIQMQTVVSLVSSGLGVAIVPASIANLGRRGVVYREIADPHPRLDLWMAWRRGELGAMARDFLAHARRSAR